MTQFLLTLLLLGQAMPKPQTDQERLAALQLSEACRADGEHFWQREGYPELAHEVGTSRIYLTHYSRERGKCFIQIDTSKKDKDPRTLLVSIYDAVEGALIADMTNAWDGKHYKPIGLMIDGVDLEVTQANRAKFGALMER